MTYENYKEVLLHSHKKGTLVRTSCLNDHSIIEAKNEKYQMKICSLELMDGVLLTFGDYEGDFEDINIELGKPSLFVGCLLNGSFEAVFDKSQDFALRQNDTYSCAPNLCDMSLNSCTKCFCIQFAFDIQRASKELSSFLKNVSLERLYERMSSLPNIYTDASLRALSTLKPNLNPDLLRLSVLESLIIIDEKSKQLSKDEGYVKQLKGFLSQNALKEELNLSFLSDKFRVSRAKLSADFKKGYKMSVYQFIKACKM